jgi:ATP-binding cassette subfamily B protein
LLGVLAFLRPYPKLTLLAVGLLLIVISLEMTLPQVLGRAITAVRAHQRSGTPFNPLIFAALFFGIVAARNVTAFLLGPIRNRLVQRALQDIRSAIYDAVQRLSFSYHDAANTGELISRSSTDVWRLQEFLFAALFLSVDITVSIVATIILVFATSIALGWVTVLTIVPTIALIAFYARKLHPQWRKVHDQHAAMTTVIQENIAGVRVVKAFAMERAETRKFRGKSSAYLDTLLGTINYWAARVPFAQFVFGLGVPLVLWLGGREVINGTLLIGDLAKVVFYLLAIGHRVQSVGRFTNIIQNASASGERVLEVIEDPARLISGKKPLPPGGGEVRFEQVTFANDKQRALLTDVSFIARPGETTAIVGPTGAGKSTLINLIPRFYDPTKGRVTIDGADVRDLRLPEVRRAIGMIFQETFLFSASVADNIAYGRPEARRDEIERAATAAQAHEFIMELENGYETIIGERGISLSGGQKQRLSIARAFLMNPRILILDDATAAVDSQTERLIQQAMREVTRGRTTFIIAHRFSTVQHAHQILVLQEGRIVERGTHEELIRSGGFYHEIFAGQTRAEEPTSNAILTA